MLSVLQLSGIGNRCFSRSQWAGNNGVSDVISVSGLCVYGGGQCSGLGSVLLLLWFTVFTAAWVILIALFDVSSPILSTSTVSSSSWLLLATDWAAWCCCCWCCCLRAQSSMCWVISSGVRCSRPWQTGQLWHAPIGDGKSTSVPSNLRFRNLPRNRLCRLFRIRLKVSHRLVLPW